MAVIRTPIAAPKANSDVERQIGSTRRECLDWILILNRRHLERVLTEWVEHYNQARPHRGLDLQTPKARSDPVVASGPVRCDERLGGLLREYSRTPIFGRSVRDSVTPNGARAPIWAAPSSSRDGGSDASSGWPITRTNLCARQGHYRRKGQRSVSASLAARAINAPAKVLRIQVITGGRDTIFSRTRDASRP